MLYLFFFSKFILFRIRNWVISDATPLVIKLIIRVHMNQTLKRRRRCVYSYFWNLRLFENSRFDFFFIANVKKSSLYILLHEVNSGQFTVMALRVFRLGASSLPVSQFFLLAISFSTSASTLTGNLRVTEVIEVRSCFVFRLCL